MNTLNLKHYAMAVLLAASFAFLPPCQAQQPVTVVKSVKGLPPGVDLKSADKAIRHYAEAHYLDISGSSLEISTNAPPGFVGVVTVGQPLYYTPNLTLLVVCGYVLLVIVVAGVTYWIYVKVCNALNNLASNRNWQQTNILPESISMNAGPPPAIGSGARGQAYTGASATPVYWPYAPDTNATFAFYLLSTSNLNSSWATNCVIVFTNSWNTNIAVGVFDAQGSPLALSALPSNGIGATLSLPVQSRQFFRLGAYTGSP
jgi:hypothetical protein